MDQLHLESQLDEARARPLAFARAPLSPLHSLMHNLASPTFVLMLHLQLDLESQLDEARATLQRGRAEREAQAAHEEAIARRRRDAEALKVAQASSKR
jgi:hypothetical protein